MEIQRPLPPAYRARPSLVSRVLAKPALLAAAALCALPGITVSPPAQAQSCLSAAETRQVIASGQVLPLAAIADIVRARGSVEIASVSLCTGGGAPAYAVVAVRGSGASARLTVDAVGGAVLSER